jgi:HSP20 family protein
MRNSLIRKMSDRSFGSLWDIFEDQLAPFAELETVMGESLKAFPKVNVTEDNSAITIVAELAGWKRNDIKISIENGKRLVLSGNSVSDNDKDKKYLVRELKRSKFQRTFLLGELLNNENVSAKFVDGLLTIVIQKLPMETKSSREITIS